MILDSFFNMYGIMIAIGIVLCFLCLYIFEKKFITDHKFMDFVVVNGCVAIFIGFLSAAIFQGVYNYIDNPENGFSINGGITFIGGLIGGVISFLVGYQIFKNKYQTKLIEIISYIPPAIVIAHAFGRVGCYFSECCYGVETDKWYGIILSNGTKVIPTHLFEAGFLFILFIVLFILAYKKKFLYNFCIYTFSYGVWRFLIEYLRGDERGSFIPGVSPSQFWSLVMIIITIPLAFYLYYCNKKVNEINK